MNAITIDNHEGIASFRRSIERLRPVPMAGPWHSIKRFWIIARQIRDIEKRSSEVAVHIRARLEGCGTACTKCDNNKCQAELLDIALEARAALLEVDDVFAGQGVFYQALRKPLHNVIIEFDDLVEDITLATDGEFKSLVSELGNHLR